jgi:hypothetical protein
MPKLDFTFHPAFFIHDNTSSPATEERDCEGQPDLLIDSRRLEDRAMQLAIFESNRRGV